MSAHRMFYLKRILNDTVAAACADPTDEKYKHLRSILHGMSPKRDRFTLTQPKKLPIYCWKKNTVR